MKTADEIMGLVVDYGTHCAMAISDAEHGDRTASRKHSTDGRIVFAEIRAALTAHMGWHPMDSAPRDGTRILLCADGLSTVGFWIDEQEDQVDVMGADAGFVDVDYQNFWPGRSFGAEQYQGHGRQPTGWMPLPPPPAEGEK